MNNLHVRSRNSADTKTNINAETSLKWRSRRSAYYIHIKKNQVSSPDRRCNTHIHHQQVYWGPKEKITKQHQLTTNFPKHTAGQPYWNIKCLQLYLGACEIISYVLRKKPNMYSRVQLRVFCTRSHPLNIFRINSSKYVMFAWVRANLLLRDSISGPSLCFFFSAFSCLWVVSRCPLRVLATDMNDVTSWSPINEATWRYTLGGALR